MFLNLVWLVWLSVINFNGNCFFCNYSSLESMPKANIDTGMPHNISTVATESLTVTTVTSEMYSAISMTCKNTMRSAFNIHMDNGYNSLTITFQSLKDSIGFPQHVNTLTHCCNGLEIDHPIVLPKNTALSDHHPLLFYLAQICTL